MRLLIRKSPVSHWRHVYKTAFCVGNNVLLLTLRLPPSADGSARSLIEVRGVGGCYRGWIALLSLGTADSLEIVPQCPSVSRWLFACVPLLWEMAPKRDEV